MTNKWGKVREALYRNDVRHLCCRDDDECADGTEFGPGTVCFQPVTVIGIGAVRKASRLAAPALSGSMSAPSTFKSNRRPIKTELRVL
jgi:hypothetical protein